MRTANLILALLGFSIGIFGLLLSRTEPLISLLVIIVGLAVFVYALIQFTSDW